MGTVRAVGQAFCVEWASDATAACDEWASVATSASSCPVCRCATSSSKTGQRATKGQAGGSEEADDSLPLGEIKQDGQAVEASEYWPHTGHRSQ